MSYQKRIITYVGIFVVLIVAYLLVVAKLISPIRSQNTNTLAIDNLSVVESLNIPIADSIDLDNLSQDEVYTLRQNAVMEYPWLIYTNYEPSKAVFSGMKDNLSWWGVTGWYYYGSGEKSAEGLSKEALQILNPYLLVSADFTGLSIHSEQNGENFWNKNLVTTVALNKSTFPYYAKPENLRWWPERSRIEVTYDLSAYLSTVNHWTTRSYKASDVTFDLIASNARDMNMNYIWVDYDQSINIGKENKPGNVSDIQDRITQNNDCGLSGGCNTLETKTSDIHGLQIQSLPAKLIISLWDSRPASPTDTPDLTYVINIK